MLRLLCGRGGETVRAKGDRNGVTGHRRTDASTVQYALGLHRVKPDRVPAPRGESGQGLPPLIKKLQLLLANKGKISFSIGKLLGIESTL